jgi:hypothetical protein
MYLFVRRVDRFFGFSAMGGHMIAYRTTECHGHRGMATWMRAPILMFIFIAYDRKVITSDPSGLPISERAM